MNICQKGVETSVTYETESAHFRTTIKSLIKRGLMIDKLTAKRSGGMNRMIAAFGCHYENALNKHNYILICLPHLN